MYTLVLTIVISAGLTDYGMDTEIEKIEGFHTEALCREAGQKWLDYTNSKRVLMNKSAICMKVR